MRATTLCIVTAVLGWIFVNQAAAGGPDEFADRLARVEPWESRVNERQPPDIVMDAVGVKSGMVIGEVGAGRGRYTVHLSDRVGEAGKIFANDIDAEALEFLQERFKRVGITNVETVLGDVEDPRFPEKSLDMIFMVWVYHMVESPVPLLKSFGSSLKPGASVVMVEPPPEEIQREVDEMSANGNERVLPTVLTPERMGDFATQAGFKLIKTMDDLLEMDIIYVLERE